MNILCWETILSYFGKRPVYNSFHKVEICWSYESLTDKLLHLWCKEKIISLGDIAMYTDYGRRTFWEDVLTTMKEKQCCRNVQI